jgi:hypothetical protein
MKKLTLLGASALLFASLVAGDAYAQRAHGVKSDEVSAQRGFRGGGFGGGFRGGGFGGGFRGGMIGGGFRGAGFGGRGFVGRPIGFGGRGFVGRPIGFGGRGFVGRGVAWGGGWGWRRGWGWGGGWGWPVAAGVGLGLAAGYYGSCWRWDGWTWVNVCYGPYYAGYGGYPYY